MKLRGQHGYAMAALLVALAVMAIMMTAAMPTWRQMVRRDREAELVFRGQQYARAIGLYQRKAGPGVLPPNLDVLVDQKFLRKKYKDPITGEDFDLLRAGAATAPGGPAQNPQTPPAGVTPQPSAALQPGAVAGGISGVASKSKDESIREYNGRTHYNEWQFVFVPQVQQAGQGTGGGVGGGRGNPTTGPQRGTPPPGGFPQRGNAPPPGGFPQRGNGPAPLQPTQPPRR